jgi:hypothetical protein
VKTTEILVLHKSGISPALYPFLTEQHVDTLIAMRIRNEKDYVKDQLKALDCSPDSISDLLENISPLVEELKRPEKKIVRNVPSKSYEKESSTSIPHDTSHESIKTGDVSSPI